MHETLFLAIFFTLLAVVSSDPQRSGATGYGAVEPGSLFIVQR
jgi:hypothetical protein